METSAAMPTQYKCLLHSTAGLRCCPYLKFKSRRRALDTPIKKGTVCFIVQRLKATVTTMNFEFKFFCDLLKSRTPNQGKDVILLRVRLVNN